MKKACILFALLLASGVPAFAQQAVPVTNRFVATEIADERFDAGVLAVERHGNRGRPLVLIPGLASGSWVWQDTIRSLRGDHVLYVVTLPGFDGRAPVGGNMLSAVEKALYQLIVSRKLQKPVLVGHGLGGTLALSVAQQHPALAGGVVSIDGLPVFPGTEDMPYVDRPKLAAGIMQRMAGLTPQVFAAQQQQYMRSTGVVDMARADELAKLTSRSDPGATVRYMAASMEQDLRARLPELEAPVLLMVPVFDTGLEGAPPAAEKVAYYRELMAGTPKLEVLAIPDARSFAMIDNPQRVGAALRAFLASL